MANDFLGFSKVESVNSSLNVGVRIPNMTKATTEWGRRSIDEGISCFGECGIRCKDDELSGNFSESGGMGSHVEGNLSRDHAGRGPPSLFKGINSGGAEKCKESGKEVGWESNVELFPQQALNKEVGGKELLICRDTAYEAHSDGLLLEHMGSKSWVGDSLRLGISLEELEQAGVRVDEEGEEALSILDRNVDIHGSVSSGPLDGNKMEEAEETRRFEELVGDKVGKQLTVDQVFLVHQFGSESNSLFASDSAIENYNRIFWVKTDKNLASSVWGVGKEVGFSFPGREEIVLNSICSLSNQGGVTTRKMWKERRNVVNEDLKE